MTQGGTQVCGSRRELGMVLAGSLTVCIEENIVGDTQCNWNMVCSKLTCLTQGRIQVCGRAKPTSVFAFWPVGEGRVYIGGEHLEDIDRKHLEDIGGDP